MKAPERLDTGRLILRRPSWGDAERIFARYANDAEVTRYLSWPRHESIADTRGFIAFSEAEWRTWPAGPYLIELRSTGELIGATGLSFEREHEATTGYVLARDAWGCGFATEALLAVIGVCEGIGVRAVYALCHPQHSASQRVLEKCGFSLDRASQDECRFPNLGAVSPVLRFVRGFT